MTVTSSPQTRIAGIRSEGKFLVLCLLHDSQDPLNDGRTHSIRVTRAPQIWGRTQGHRRARWWIGRFYPKRVINTCLDLFRYTQRSARYRVTKTLANILNDIRNHYYLGSYNHSPVAYAQHSKNFYSVVGNSYDSGINARLIFDLKNFRAPHFLGHAS